MLTMRTGGASYHVVSEGIQVIQAGGGDAAFAGAYDAIPSIAAAYGMRRLRGAYAGNLLRLRRSSDSAVSDFGYAANGDLDAAAIATFVGGGSGYITTWYDQSGNGNNAVQTTAANQPLYVASGQNGKPVARFDGSNDLLTVPDADGLDINLFSILSVTKRAGAGDGNSVILLKNASVVSGAALYGQVVEISGGADNRKMFNAFNTGTWSSVAASTTVTIDGTYYLLVTQYDGSNAPLYVNGVQEANPAKTGSIAASTGSLQIGGFDASFSVDEHMNGDIAELVIANAAWGTTDRQAAEAAVNAYFAIY